MSYIILGSSLIIVFLMIWSQSIFYKYNDRINLKIKKRLDVMLKFIKIAPIIVLFIIMTLTLTYFKTKFEVRLSHAWLVLNFWMCAMILYYITAEIAIIRKMHILILPVIGLIVSICIAIYLTPLFHYENLFKNINIVIPDTFGLIMVISSYCISYSLLKK